MREEPGAMQQSCRTAPHKQQTCVLISFCWTCIWTCYLNMLFAIIVVVLPRPIHYSQKNALKSCQVVKHFSTSKFSSQLRLLISRWMIGVYRQQRQTRHFILQKPSSCENDYEDTLNSHAGQHCWNSNCSHCKLLPLLLTGFLTCAFCVLLFTFPQHTALIHVLISKSHFLRNSQVLQRFRMSQSSTSRLSFAF